STGWQQGCTTKTSAPRTFSKIWKRVSPSEKRPCSARPTGTPRKWQIACVRAEFAVPQNTLNLSSPKACPLVLRTVIGSGLSRRRAIPARVRTFAWRESPPRTRSLPGTLGRLGAPALGFGILQTPPNRYPPARLPSLLAEATVLGFRRDAGDG